MIADSRSHSCSGVGVTTDAIRRAAASTSAAVSGEAFGLWLSSADTGQWCHVVPSTWVSGSVHGGQNEHRNLAVGLGLVLGVVRIGLDGSLPPGGPLVAEHLAGVVVTGVGAVLELDAEDPGT